MEVLNRPHLMLSDISGNHRIHRQAFCNHLEHLIRCQDARYLVVTDFGRIREDKVGPLFMLLLCHTLIELRQNLLRIADDMVIGLDILVDLRTVDIDVYDICFGSKCLRVERHTV